MSNPTLTPAEQQHAAEAAPLGPAQVGMLAFLCSEGAFFATLLVAYITYLGHDLIGPTPKEVLSLPLAIINSVMLLSSSGTIALAAKAHAGERSRSAIGWLVMTMLLGCGFLVGTGYEWYGLIVHDGLTISRNLFGSTFFTLIGFHGLHVSLGIVAMGIVAWLLWRRLLPATSQGLELVAWYWHFVDAVWVVILLVVYWLGRT